VIIALVNVLLIAGATFTSVRSRRTQPFALMVVVRTALVIAFMALTISLIHEFEVFEATPVVAIITTFSVCITAVALVWFAVWDFVRRTTGPRSSE
jgi:hypothetical protein